MPFLRHRRPARPDDRQLGQSLVELALILPVMLVLLAGVLDLGRIFYATITLNNAAREGALQASSTPTSYVENQPCNTSSNLVVCRIEREARGSMVTVKPTDIDMTCSLSGCPRQIGSTVTVEVRGQFVLLTPLLAGVFGGQTLPMSSTATAQMRYFPDPGLATPPPNPIAGFTSDRAGDLGAVPQTVQFTNTTSAGATYSWDFGDGSAISHEEHPQHTYTTPGTYTVTLTAVNLTAVDVEIKTAYITVGSAAPTATATSTATSTATTAPTSTPQSCNPPNIVGMTVADANAALINNGWAFTSATVSSGQKGKVQAQLPDHTVCVTGTRTIHYLYRPN